MAKSSGGRRPSLLHAQILEIIKQHPTGISEGEMRTLLGIPTHDMAQFGRRRRELNSWYEIGRRRHGMSTLYYFIREREQARDASPLGIRIRAEVLAKANGRCSMCGRSVSGDGIKLHVDHMIPRDWGGPTELENLWALCEDCNQGKKAHFASLKIDSEIMRAVMANQSVHMRIGELLRAMNGAPVPSFLIDFVANQHDWRKRLRELRYLGWEIEVVQERRAGRRAEVSYRLVTSRPWPEEPTKTIRIYERNRSHQTG